MHQKHLPQRVAILHVFSTINEPPFLDIVLFDAINSIRFYSVLVPVNLNLNVLIFMFLNLADCILCARLRKSNTMPFGSLFADNLINTDFSSKH